MTDVTLRDQLIQSISDLSKDVNGFRDRRNYSILTDSELIQLRDSYSDLLVTEIARENAMYLESQRRWEKWIAELIECGAGTRRNAIRWDMSAQECSGDVAHYCYTVGLAYELEDQIREDLR